jgi:hypothetical protein
MSQRILILAGGEGLRWQNHLGVRKHLIPIHGEPLIHRTQRLFAERGISDIRVVCSLELAADYVTEVGTHEPLAQVDRAWVQEQESSRRAWNGDGRTIIVYGDVYYSHDLVDSIAHDNGEPWRVFARWGASAITGKGYGEMFAWSFNAYAHRTLDNARNRAIAAKEAGRWWRCLGWEVYREAVGIPIREHERDDVHGFEWSDVTDDFDYPEDWDRWSRLNPGLWQ